MADIRISALPALTTPTDADIVHALDDADSKDKKLALSAIKTYAQAGVVTSVAGTAPISVTGTATRTVVIAAASTSAPGSMSAEDKTKLDGVATGATANDTDANLKNRGNHTGNQVSATISDFTSASRAQVEATLTAGANITLTPAGIGPTRTIAISSTAAGGGATNLDGLSDVTLTSPASEQVLKYNGSQWINAAAPGGGGGTVTQVDGGAGLTGSVTTTGSLAVGAGTGITVNANDVQINRTTTDAWYATAAQGALAATALQPGSVDLGYTAATRTITNTGGDPAVLPLFGTAAGLVPGTASGTTNFLRADGTWAAPAGGGATNLDGLTDVTITTPATDQVLKYNGTAWINAAAPGGGGGTVTQVDGGAGLTGSVTTTGSLAVGAGTGITVAADAVSVNRTVVDTWYATAAQGTLAGTALQPGSVDLGYTAATRTITNTGGDGVALPLFSTTAGLVPGTASGTTNFLRADGTWAAPAGGATNLDGLSDVTITAAATDQTLIRDAAGQFRNQPLPAPARSEYYLWKTAAQTVDPGAGGIGGNNDIWESSTAIHVNQAALDGTLMTSWYSTFKKGMRFLIQNRANPTSYIAGIITATPTNQTGYSIIPVQIIETNGGEPTADTPVVLQISGPTVLSDPTAATGADQITNMISLTQAEYDAIGSKSATTLYVITP